MAQSFRSQITGWPASDLAELTGLSKRESEVLFHSMRDRTDEEIAEEMDVEVGTVKSFKSKIRRKGNQAKTNLRVLMVSGVYEPSDVVVEFHEKSNYDDKDVLSENLGDYLIDLLEQEEEFVREVHDFRRQLSRTADDRRRKLARLKGDLARRGIIDAEPWEMMDRSERSGWVKDSIAQLEALKDDPVPHEDVIEKVTRETSASIDAAETVIDRLLTRGEIYRPLHGTYRVT